MFTYRGLIANMFMRLCSLLPLEDKVVFSSFDGKAVNDNPRELYLELKKTKPELKFVWVLKDMDPIVSNDIVVKPYSFSYLFHLATAKLWVDNSRKKEWTYKRKGQYYVQTWHGDIALKKIEKDAETELSDTYIKNAKYDASITDLMISGSDFGTNMFRKSFWYKGEVLEKGSPKSTIYYKAHNEVELNVRKELGIEEKEKIVLYCPTFRNQESLSAYDIDYNELNECLEKEWGGKWVTVIRLHPKLKELSKMINYNETLINGSLYPSTSELVIACDLLITDYSSCMFDGLEANKRVLLYASDIEDYLKKDRGMYFDIRNLPFPLVENMTSLKTAIQSFDSDLYNDRTSKFKKILGIKTNSKSTSNIVQYIIQKVWQSY